MSQLENRDKAWQDELCRLMDREISKQIALSPLTHEALKAASDRLNLSPLSYKSHARDAIERCWYNKKKEMDEWRQTFIYGRGCGKTPHLREDGPDDSHYGHPGWLDIADFLNKDKFLSISSLKNKSMKNFNCGTIVFFFGEAAHYRKPTVESGIITMKRTIESLDGKSEIEYTINGSRIADEAAFESKEALLASL